jgi:hypothetical protein
MAYRRHRSAADGESWARRQRAGLDRGAMRIPRLTRTMPKHMRTRQSQTQLPKHLPGENHGEPSEQYGNDAAERQQPFIAYALSELYSRCELQNSDCNGSGACQRDKHEGRNRWREHGGDRSQNSDYAFER